MKRIWIFVIAIVGIIVILLVLKKSGAVGKHTGITVAADYVAKADITETVSASGKIYPKTELNLSSEVPGEIINLHVQEGDSVKMGDLLIEVNPNISKAMLEQSDAMMNQTKAALANAKASLSQAQANFDQSKVNYNRNLDLHNNKVISDADFETIEVAYKSAQAQLESANQSVTGAEYSVKSAEAQLTQAQEQLAKTTIYAPMSGTVSKLDVVLGQRVVGTSQMPGTELLRIANLYSMEVRVDVSENDIIRVAVGDTALIDVDAYLDRKFKGVVTQISNSASTGDAQAALTSEQVTNFTVKIGILPSSYKDLITAANKFPFRPGMSASVDIETSKSNAVMAVPIQSVIARDTSLTSKADTSKNKTAADKIKSYVFVVNGNKAKMVEVKTGIQDDRFIQILGGLKGDELVVTGPFKAISQDLKNNTEVKVEKSKKP